MTLISIVRSQPMTTVERRIAPPERLAGQGLDPNQHESGDRAIVALLTDASHGETDWAATYRYETDSEGEPLEGAYEVWALRGMIRFRRFIAEDGRFGYEVIEQIGENPIANQDPTAVATVAEEMEAAAASGMQTEDPNRAFMEPHTLSYPLAYEKIAQLFDSPNAPDIVVNPKAWQFGRQPGQHGTADVVQARAPLIFSGPGITTTGVTDTLCAQVDIAPTLAKVMGMPLIDGMDCTGRTSSERGVDPDVYLKRQDGQPIDEIISDDQQPDRVYIFLLDGLSNTELKERLERDRESIPNISRIIENGLMFRYGTIVNFPSITWPSHNALGTGAWCGHHDIVNPTYYLRETRETVTPQGSIWETGKYLSDSVETLYEAVHRVWGKWDGNSGEVTASINEPCMRGAGHSTLERRVMIDSDELAQQTRNNREDTNPRWAAEGQEGVRRYSYTDIQGTVQSMMLFASDTLPPPKFTYHEFALTDAVGHEYGPHHPALLDALVETDKRIGKILRILDERGLYDSTLFVITTDHGMAPVDAKRAADQMQAVPEAGLHAVCTAPLIYLLDLAVVIEPAADGRTVTVTTLANDANERAEKPPVPAANVQVIGQQGQVIAQAQTDAHGLCGLPLPVGEDAEGLVIRIKHEGYNARHLRLDGTTVADDPRRRLYADL
jgi:phosphonoacetate hydrolase